MVEPTSESSIKKSYVSSAASAFAVLCGAMAPVTVGASIFDVDSPLELFFSGVVSAMPIALLAPLYEETEHPLDRFLLTLLIVVRSTIAFAAAAALVWWDPLRGR